jgi:plastocyanin
METKLFWMIPVLVAAPLYVPAETPSATIATATSTPAADTTISIHDFSFSPMSLTVSVGTTVRWKNLDGEPHTVRSLDTSFRSDPLDQNDSFAFKFDQPGTYRYVCSIHPQMLGTIVVKGATAN